MASAISVVAGCGDDEGSGGNGASGGAGGAGGAGGGSSLAWEDCYTNLQCATVDVPVDYTAPDGAHIGIRIVRIAAGGERRGAVLVNFGGPGVPGVSTLAAIAAQLPLVLPETSDSFDLIGFDWRGAGQSNPLHCLEDAEYDAIRDYPYDPTTPAEQMLHEDGAAQFQDGCVANNDADFIASVHSENAARDMDEIRRALGDDLLHYVGISYGSWLGATYATLFPDQVGAMVLDSPLGTLAPPASLLRRAEAQEAALNRFIADCAADAGCAFHGGTDVTTVETALDAVLADITAGNVDAGGAPLSRTRASGAIFYFLNGGTPRWPQLAAALADAETSDGAALAAASDLGVFKGPDGYANYLDALLPIVCLDQPFPTTFTWTDYWSAIDGLDATAPRMGHSINAGGTCIGWPVIVDQADISAPTAPPVLLLAGRHDPSTPYEGADELRAALDNGSHLVTYEGDGHGLISISACVRGLVDAFMVDPTVAPSTTTCPAE